MVVNTSWLEVQDIQLRVGAKDKPGKQVNLPTQLTQEHIVNRYRLSLRVSETNPFSIKKKGLNLYWCVFFFFPGYHMSRP
jgi:hypothetical protein